MVWACDEKRGALRRKEGGGNESTGRRKRGRPKRRWLDRMRDDIKEKGLSGECYMEAYIVKHRPPHKSWTKMK